MDVAQCLSDRFDDMTEEVLNIPKALGKKKLAIIVNLKAVRNKYNTPFFFKTFFKVDNFSFLKIHNLSPTSFQTQKSMLEL